jgi:nucleotide-binding universal stress UspA family protein
MLFYFPPQVENTFIFFVLYSAKDAYDVVPKLEADGQSGESREEEMLRMGCEDTITDGDLRRSTMEETAHLTENQIETAARRATEAQGVFRRILVPTDFSHRSQVALDYAVQLARLMQGQLTLLHVFPEPSALDYTMNGPADEEWDQAREGAKNNLADAVAHAKRSFLEVDSKFRSGPDLRTEILRTAKEISADLLVLSTHGYTGWKRLLLGSDAENILEHAPCPVLVVH